MCVCCGVVTVSFEFLSILSCAKKKSAMTVSRCFQVFPGVSGCFRVFQGVSGSFEVLRGVSRFFEVF